jgi:biopolymer transport protein ExbB/TolQ
MKNICFTFLQSIFSHFSLHRSVFAWVILLFAIFSISNCKKKKLPEFHDEIWRRESLEMASSFCAKYLECSAPVIEKLDKKLQNFAKNQMSTSECVERFKKSNVFRLRGEIPDTIKNSYRTCFVEFQKLNCDDLQNGKLDSLGECNQIRAIQKL